LFETVLGGSVRAAFGGFTCCYCGIALDKGYVEAFDNRMRCEHPRCAEVDAKARARGL
jgi:hypothetical protein